MLSVEAQTCANRIEHLVEIDVEKTGCSATMNRLAERARGEWLFLLADDDLLLPRCIDSHLGAAVEADIVYSRPLVWGEAPDQFCQTPPAIPAVALIKAEVWKRLGGYPKDATHLEDRDFWCRAAERGFRFVLAENGPTWVYRFHGGNKSRKGTAS